MHTFHNMYDMLEANVDHLVVEINFLKKKTLQIMRQKWDTMLYFLTLEGGWRKTVGTRSTVMVRHQKSW